MRNNQHQQKVCEAVVRLMADRRREKLSTVGVPDEEERQKRAVDLKFQGASSEFVMEHTLIESFPHQIRDGHRFINLLGPLEATLSGTLPTPGHYKLVVAPGAVDGATDGETIQMKLEAWVRYKAPALQIGSPSTAPNHYVREIPPGVSFEVTLYRWPGLDGKFFISRSVPNELEKKRCKRIRSALEAKCSKLKEARGNHKTSILVLESNDISLGNHIDIADAAIKELSNRRDDIPDEVHLVETDIEPWTVWVLKEGPKLFFDVPDAGPHYIEPHTLDKH